MFNTYAMFQPEPYVITGKKGNVVNTRNVIHHNVTQSAQPNPSEPGFIPIKKDQRNWLITCGFKTETK